MLTLFIIILLALIFFAYVAIPLIFPSQNDALPDLRDPVKQDLEEERDALLRAIRELDARDDLAQARREQLRARYEAKAAKVLRTLDDHSALVKGQVVPRPQSQSRKRLPYATLTLLALMVISATVMTSYILPRVGNGSLTTFFEGDLEQAKALRDLQRAAERNPSEESLLALGDAYWQVDDSANAEATYMRMTTILSPVPASAYSRLGYLKLQVANDLNAALDYFEQARALNPSDLDSLFTLAEIYFSQARPDEAIASLETYLSLAEDEEVKARLSLFKTLAPVLKQASLDPSEENLLALADSYWQVEERERAADIYVRILSSINAHNALAYSRIGQLLFFGGRTEQAIDLLDRARAIDDSDLNTLLFLGNAHFSLNQFAEAIASWERYLEVAGEAEAGRIPELIENAKARLLTAGPAGETATLTVAQLYTSHCSACHGSNGQGGAGPALVANRSAMNEANVRSIIQYGRGLMPGFIASLSEEQIGLLTDYIVNTLSQGQSSERR